MREPGYIVYIDEAGDPGLKRVAPVDERGASEWFIVAGALIRKSNETNAPVWLDEIRREARNTQGRDLHFRKLSHGQKMIACQMLANLPVRLFVVMSNKQNMRRHRNQAAANISRHKNWFYWWMMRLLMERVTDFCAATNRKGDTPGRTVRVEFSSQKGLRLHHFTDYFTRLWFQETPTLGKRQIDWSVFDVKDVHFFDHANRAGLQFADVAASAFYQAVNRTPAGKTCSAYATALSRVIATRHGVKLDEGLTFMPKSLGQADLTEDQKEVFRAYGVEEWRLTKTAARGPSSQGR